MGNEIERMRVKGTKAIKWIFLAILYSLFSICCLYAANPATVDLKVTVNVPLSVDIGSTAVSLGTLTEARAMKISTGAIPVTNDSAGRTEDYLISATNSADWTISGSTIGTNQFVLQALISTSTARSPTNSDFEAKFSTLTTTNANMTFSNYGFNGTDGHGNNVPANITKYLWFRFIAPSEISQGNGVEQSISVTVTAADASSY